MAGVKLRCCHADCPAAPIVFIPGGIRCQMHANADLQRVERDMIEAVVLLRDYVRVYPNNSGRAIRFLATLDGAAPA